MHLIVQELLVFLVVPAAIEVPALVLGGSARTQDANLELGFWVGDLSGSAAAAAGDRTI